MNLNFRNAEQKDTALILRYIRDQAELEYIEDCF